MKLETVLNVCLLLALLAALTYPVTTLFTDAPPATTGDAVAPRTDDAGARRIAEQITSAGLVSGALFLIARKVACGT
jgi:hypothetical protein